MKIENTQSKNGYIELSNQREADSTTEKVMDYKVPERILQAVCVITPALLPIGPFAVVVYPICVAGFLYATHEILKEYK